jgi:hypothetical protein
VEQERLSNGCLAYAGSGPLVNFFEAPVGLAAGFPQSSAQVIERVYWGPP